MIGHHENEQAGFVSPEIRLCADNDMPDILRIINAAAVAYRGVIPADRWHEPYMSPEEFRAEIAADVYFTGCVADEALVGVMGIQRVRNVRLIRHAYVLPDRQGHGVGSKLIAYLRGADHRPILIGTWRAAVWAIRFYEKHGFALVPNEAIAPLLNSFWNVPERQVETSVVLSSPAFSTQEAARLISGI